MEHPDLRRVTEEYKNALPDSDPDKAQIAADLRVGAEGGGSPPNATTFWEGRPPDEYYVAVYPPFFESATEPYQAWIMLHEGVHLQDPANMIDDSSRGPTNNAYPVSGFAAQLAGLPYPSPFVEEESGLSGSCL